MLAKDAIGREGHFVSDKVCDLGGVGIGVYDCQGNFENVGCHLVRGWIAVSPLYIHRVRLASYYYWREGRDDVGLHRDRRVLDFEDGLRGD